MLRKGGHLGVDTFGCTVGRLEQQGIPVRGTGQSTITPNRMNALFPVWLFACIFYSHNPRRWQRGELQGQLLVKLFNNKVLSHIVKLEQQNNFLECYTND